MSGADFLATPSALNNRGVGLRRQGKPAVAEVYLRRAIALAPAVAAYRSNLGNVLRDLAHYDEAVGQLTRAVSLEPGNAGYAYNLALALRDAGQHKDALSRLVVLSHAQPDDPDISWDLALSHLSLGDLRRGFAGYEARLRLERFTARSLPGPRWDGGPLAGKTIFVHAEQGFGDSLQFIRFVPVLAERGARVIVECVPSLAPLFREMAGVAYVVEDGKSPVFDLWAPLCSLPFLLGIDEQTLAAQKFPYLRTSRRLTHPLHRPGGARLAVGLVWSGNAKPRDRSWSLTSLLPLLFNPELAFYSLQVGPQTAQLEQLGLGDLVVDVGGQVSSFADTAAVMSQLDLVISIDSAPAHLAGALGLPTWVLLRYVSDWRWGTAEVSTPWYPSMRLFRQSNPDDFHGPVAAMVAQLEGLDL